MLVQDVHADADEHQRSNDRSFAAEKFRAAKRRAEPQAKRREHGTDKTDDDRRLPDGNARHGKGKAHGKRVDAGGHGQKQKRDPPRRVALTFLLFLAPEGLAEHIQPHEKEKCERYPVIPCLDQIPQVDAMGT